MCMHFCVMKQNYKKLILTQIILSNHEIIMSVFIEKCSFDNFNCDIRLNV